MIYMKVIYKNDDIIFHTLNEVDDSFSKIWWYIWWFSLLLIKGTVIEDFFKRITNLYT